MSIARRLLSINAGDLRPFKFTIEKPLYLKPLAIVSYLLLFIVITSIIQYINRLYYRRQKKSLLSRGLDRVRNILPK